MAHIEALSAELMLEIQQLQTRAARLLRLTLQTEPKQIVEAITAFLRQAKERGDRLEEDDVVGLGVLLGEQYVRAYGWRWGQVSWSELGGESSTCVLSPHDAKCPRPPRIKRWGFIEVTPMTAG